MQVAMTVQKWRMLSVGANRQDVIIQILRWLSIEAISSDRRSQRDRQIDEAEMIDCLGSQWRYHLISTPEEYSNPLLSEGGRNRLQARGI